MLEGQGCLDEGPALSSLPAPLLHGVSVMWQWWWFLPVQDSDFWRSSRMGSVVSSCSRPRFTIYSSLENTVPHIGWQWGGAFWHHDWPWDQPRSIKCYQGKVRARWCGCCGPCRGTAVMTQGLASACWTLTVCWVSCATLRRRQDPLTPLCRGRGLLLKKP